MADYSRHEAAERAGITVEELGQVVEAGILAPASLDRFAASDVLKASLVHSLVAGGLELNDLAEALRDATLSLDFVERPSYYERFGALSEWTFATLSLRTGVPVELLMVIREATGSAPPSPDDLVRESELAIVKFVERTVAQGFRPGATERLLRAFGDSARRLAEIESAWWDSEVVAPRLAAGAGQAEIAEYDSSAELAKLTEDTLVSMYRAQQTHIWTANIIDGFEHVLAAAGKVTRLERPPAMCFLDLTGYTRLTEERGDEAAAQLAVDLGRMVQRTSVQYGGHPVKWLGDGVMLYFADPGPGVVAALEMAAAVTDGGLPPAHVGLHAGPVIVQGGDYYGQTVNLASRIAEYARPGEVVVSQAVADASRDVSATFTDIGPVELKGVGGPVHLYLAHRA